jgi:hypothetical protein
MHSSQRNEHIERVVVVSGYNVDATINGAAAVLTIIAQDELNGIDATLPLVEQAKWAYQAGARAPSMLYPMGGPQPTSMHRSGGGVAEALIQQQQQQLQALQIEQEEILRRQQGMQRTAMTGTLGHPMIRDEERRRDSQIVETMLTDEQYQLFVSVCVHVHSWTLADDRRTPAVCTQPSRQFAITSF